MQIEKVEGICSSSINNIFYGRYQQEPEFWRHGHSAEIAQFPIDYNRMFNSCWELAKRNPNSDVVREFQEKFLSFNPENFPPLKGFNEEYKKVESLKLIRFLLERTNDRFYSFQMYDLLSGDLEIEWNQNKESKEHYLERLERVEQKSVALRYLEKSADMGSLTALDVLIERYSEEPTNRLRVQKAIGYASRLAKARDPFGYSKLAEFYESSPYVKKDLPLANKMKSMAEVYQDKARGNGFD